MGQYSVPVTGLVTVARERAHALTRTRSLLRGVRAVTHTTRAHLATDTSPTLKNNYCSDLDTTSSIVTTITIKFNIETISAINAVHES